MPSTWPGLTDVRKFLRLQPDPNEDAVISAATAAAVEYGVAKYGYDSTTGLPKHDVSAADVPDAGVQAATMHAARLYRRRDTVDGTIAFGDMGAIRVGRVDPDIEALYAIHGTIVFG